MEIHIPRKNTEHYINKQILNKLLEPVTIKEDDNNNEIYPYLPVGICDNLIYNNVLLQTSISTLAEDTIFNDINFKQVTNNNEQIKEQVLEYWNLNQDEFCKQITDWYSYGFGGSEVILDSNGVPRGLYQIPANTLHIRKETKKNDDNEDETYYYAVQKVNSGKSIKMKLSHYDYPESDENLPTCFWLGGGRKSNFYDYPFWISAFNQVSASVSLDKLDADKLADGNLVSGILLIKRPPAPITNDNENIEDTLEEKMTDSGTGVFTLELVSMNPNIPLEVDYIQISESNYDYLENLASKCDAKILACSKIPKARLLIDDTTESMNSNKTNTLYKIYAMELENRQRPIENMINIFNVNYFDFEGKININTPQFVDEKETEAQTTINLFNAGLITLGQAIMKVQKIYGDFAEIEINETNPIYNERFYNGQPLGFNNASSDNPVTEVGDLIDYLKIT